MILCKKHSARYNFPVSVPVDGEIKVPARAKKLVGVAVISSDTISTDRNTSTHNGFTFKMQTNNKSDNSLNQPMHDGYLNVFDTIEEKRLLEVNIDLKPNTQIDYTIIPLSAVTGQMGTLYSSIIKVYFKFE